MVDAYDLLVLSCRSLQRPWRNDEALGPLDHGGRIDQNGAQIKKKKAIRIHRESIEQVPILIEQKPKIE